MGKSSLYRVHNWYGAVQNFRRSVSRLAEEGPLDSDVVKQECASLIERFPREILPATHQYKHHNSQGK